MIIFQNRILECWSLGFFGFRFPLTFKHSNTLTLKNYELSLLRHQTIHRHQ